MVEFALPWMFALLPLPLLVYWLSPPFKEQSDSLQVPFFPRLVILTGQKPTSGATVLNPNWIQKLLTLLCWLLVVTALAKPQLLDKPIVQVESAVITKSQHNRVSNFCIQLGFSTVAPEVGFCPVRVTSRGKNGTCKLSLCSLNGGDNQYTSKGRGRRANIHGKANSTMMNFSYDLQEKS